MHIRGLLVCCCNSMILGIHGFSNTGRPFKKFVELMRQHARTGYLHWIYFPLNENECIEAAWTRKLKNCSTIAFGPVLIVSYPFLFYAPSMLITDKLQTSLRRTVTFGPQLPARIIDFYEYLPLVQDGDGTISGLFHDGLGSVSRYVSAFGVACNAQSQLVRCHCCPWILTMNRPKFLRLKAP